MPTELGATGCVPLWASAPLQDPDAVQLLANESDHVIVAELPRVTEVELMDSVGAGGVGPVLKDTVLAANVPVAFVQVSV